jgi:hypothetical protein
MDIWNITTSEYEDISYAPSGVDLMPDLVKEDSRIVKNAEGENAADSITISEWDLWVAGSQRADELEFELGEIIGHSEAGVISDSSISGLKWQDRPRARIYALAKELHDMPNRGKRFTHTLVKGGEATIWQDLPGSWSWSCHAGDGCGCKSFEEAVSEATEACDIITDSDEDNHRVDDIAREIIDSEYPNKRGMYDCDDEDQLKQIGEDLFTALLPIACNLALEGEISFKSFEDRLKEVWELAKSDAQHWVKEAASRTLPDPQSMHLDWQFPSWAEECPGLEGSAMQRLSFAIANADLFKQLMKSR